MDQTREATSYGHLWIYTSYYGDTSLVLDCTLWISAILVAKDLLNSLLIGTLLFSRATPLFLVPKASRNFRENALLQLRRDNVAFYIFWWTWFGYESCNKRHLMFLGKTSHFSVFLGWDCLPFLSSIIRIKKRKQHPFFKKENWKSLAAFNLIQYVNFKHIFVKRFMTLKRLQRQGLVGHAMFSKSYNIS